MRAAVVLLCVIMWAGAGLSQTTNTMERDGMRVLVGPPGKTHLRIEIDDLPFTDLSLLYAWRPGEAGRYYGYEDDWAPFKKSVIGKTSATFPLLAPRGEFGGTQTLELLPERRLRLSVNAKMTTSVSGLFEHRIGGIFSNWVLDRPFEAETTAGKQTGQVPANAAGVETPVVSSFKSLKIETVRGPLTITASGTHLPSLQDWRRNRFRFFDVLPIFWLGIERVPFASDELVSYTVELKFPPKGDEQTSRAIALEKKQAAEQVVLESDTYKAPLLPTPKKFVTWSAPASDGRKSCIVGTAVAELHSPVSADTRDFSFALATEINTEFFGSDDSATSGHPIVLRLKENRSATSDEEYRINVVSETGAVAESHTTIGLLNATRTIRQLLARSAASSVGTRLQDEEQREYELPLCEIHDWPSMPVRAVHFYGGRGGRDTQIKMLRDVLGPMKINAVVYDCGNVVRWESHPELYGPKEGMLKKDALAFAEEARRQGIEVIPTINTFGHANWYLEKYPHLADDPKNPFAHDPTKPEVYKLTGDIYNEAADLFKPKYFHIGHDEITLKGFPKQPRLQAIGARKLILDDIRTYRDMLAARRIRTVIWGDMFIAPGEAPDFALAPSLEEAKLRRAGLPKDVVLCDWHYVAAPQSAFVNLRILNDAGFDVIGCPWYHPDNLWNYAGAAAEARTAPKEALRGETLGIVQATWAGGALTESTVDRAPDQLAAYILAAEAAWTGGSFARPEHGIDYPDIFSNIWSADLVPGEQRAGTVADLSSAANMKIKVRHTGGRVGRLQVAPNANEGIPAVRFNSRLDTQPSEIGTLTVPLNTTATLLAFTTGATMAGPPEPAIARTTIVYGDGEERAIDWKLAQNVYPLDDTKSSPNAILLNPDAKPGEARLRAHYWKNPRPGKKIKEVRTKSNNQGSGFVLAGIATIN